MLLQAICKQVWLNVKCLVQIVPRMESGRKDEPSLGWVLDKSFENLTGGRGGVVLVVIDLIL